MAVGCTVAVMVTGWPYTEAPVVTTLVVEAASVINCCTPAEVVLPLKLPSPKY
jgi:hypothetical protein